ncbi:MAG: sugar nucleotide-binding protein, partial [Gaiellaceae bacterium]
MRLPGEPRILITGAGGQLGAALREVFPEADARTRAELNVAVGPLELGYTPGLVLHAAAWTNVDGAEEDEEGARRVNVEGTRNV